MSIFHAATAACPKCGTTAEVQLVASVNADRRPDLRAAILAGTFQAQDCAKCGTPMRLAPHLSFLHIARSQWILAESAEHRNEWQTAEQEAQQLYDESFGAQAPEPARRLGAGMLPRLVFGWPALREKLFCADLELSDTTLELLKIAILHDVPKPPFADQTELRLIGGDDTTLQFAWIETATEDQLATLPVPRKVYDGVAGDTAAWAPLRAKFDGGLFVDMNRLLLG